MTVSIPYDAITRSGRIAARNFHHFAVKEIIRCSVVPIRSEVIQHFIEGPRRSPDRAPAERLEAEEMGPVLVDDEDPSPGPERVKWGQASSSSVWKSCRG